MKTTLGFRCRVLLEVWKMRWTLSRSKTLTPDEKVAWWNTLTLFQMMVEERWNTPAGKRVQRELASYRRRYLGGEPYHEPMGIDVPATAASGMLLAVFVVVAILFVALAVSRSKSSPIIIEVPPGSRLRRALAFVFSKRTMEGVFHQIINDMQEEHIEALSAGEPWKARAIRLRGYLSILEAVAALVPLSIARLAWKLWKASQ